VLSACGCFRVGRFVLTFGIQVPVIIDEIMQDTGIAVSVRADMNIDELLKDIGSQYRLPDGCNIRLRRGHGEFFAVTSRNVLAVITPSASPSEIAFVVTIPAEQVKSQPGTGFSFVDAIALIPMQRLLYVRGRRNSQ
jgi:hypothetical protein